MDHISSFKAINDGITQTTVGKPYNYYECITTLCTQLDFRNEVVDTDSKLRMELEFLVEFAREQLMDDFHDAYPEHSELSEACFNACDTFFNEFTITRHRDILSCLSGKNFYVNKSLKSSLIPKNIPARALYALAILQGFHDEVEYRVKAIARSFYKDLI